MLVVRALCRKENSTSCSSYSLDSATVPFATQDNKLFASYRGAVALNESVLY